MRFAGFFLLLLTNTSEAHDQATPPSYLEFSTFLQVNPGPSNNNVPMLTAPGGAGEFYVAGALGGRSLELLAFPKQPINPVAGYNCTAISSVARFSATGELLDWWLLYNLLTPSAISPQAILIAPNGNVVLAISRCLSLAEPPTPGAFLPTGGCTSMLTLSRDLHDVRVSTFLGAFQTTLFNAILDPDGNLIYSGSSVETFATDGKIPDPNIPAYRADFPFVARLSADATRLMQILPL